ncbi:MAG TPA: PAS domain S-box protein, partial [Gallionella sp.]|nr:PAS domain S-box protein [Gallionella sp.]
DLSDMDAEAYVGMPIRNKSGEAIGVLCAISRHKIVPPPMLKGVFAIIAARAGAEIERKRAEELVSAQHAEIERARLDWEAVFDSISHPIFLHDNEFRVIRANRAYAEQAGKPFKEIIGQPYYTLFPKSDTPLPCCLRAMEKEEEEEEVAVGEAIFRSRTFSVRSEQGVYLYSVHILEDITARRQLEGVLRESEERYRSLFENMLEGYAYCRMLFEQGTPLDFIYLDVNDAFEKITGLKEVTGKKVTEVIPGIRASNPELFEIYGRVALTGQPEQFETYIDTLGIWFSVTVYSPRKEYFVAVFNDITERKQAEEELWLRAQLLNSTADSIFVHDFDGNFVYLNEAAWKTLGYTRDELTGMNLHALDVPEYEKLIETRIRELLEKGHSTFESAHRHKDGSVMPIEVSAHIIESGGRKLVLSTVRDTTERKLAEKESLKASSRTRDALEDAIGAIAATLEQRDPYTAGHQRRVAQLATAIGEEMGLAREVLEGIHFGGLIHDLGKISVPAEILGKPGRLTDIEFSLIKVHAEAGYQIVKEIAFPWPVADMVRQHHERLDGSGYPQGLAGEQITLEARILAVADVVEAMSANRPYRPGFGMDAALDEITRGRGTQFDAMAVDACLCVIREKGFIFTK